MPPAQRPLACFVSAPLLPGPAFVASNALSRGEPPLPTTFAYAGETLHVASVLRRWRSTTKDRGDSYLARHWYEIRLDDDRTAVVYFDRKAQRRRPRWWLYTLAIADVSAP
jgi:hypothetical protein